MEENEYDRYHVLIEYKCDKTTLSVYKITLVHSDKHRPAYVTMVVFDISSPKDAQ